jgi:hypothetical protein
VIYAAAHLPLILRAESLGNGNRESGTQAEAQADHQEIDRAGRTDGSQALRTQIAADNSGINKTVKLLEKHTEQHRQRKENNSFQGAAFRQVVGQIPGHTDKPLSTAFQAVWKVITLLCKLHKREYSACFPDKKAMDRISLQNSLHEPLGDLFFGKQKTLYSFEYKVVPKAGLEL